MTHIFITIASFLFFLKYQITSVYGGDSGELVAAAYTWGIAHPPGYPLYSMVGAVLGNFIPWGTVAWRIGFLSSIPMAFAIYFLMRIVKHFSKSTIASAITGITATVLYPIWLYAIVPEVFGLYALFSSLLLYLLICWYERPTVKRFYTIVFLFGLALTHHHVVVLLAPVFLYTLYLKRHDIHDIIVPKNICISVLFFLLGFSVYLYAPIVSSQNPPFDWEHPAHIQGFFRMLLRTSYGTFRASNISGFSLLHRALNVLTFFQYLWKDFQWIGSFFALTGIIFPLIKKQKSIYLIHIYCAILIFFLFYAGFPITSDFALGTMERFFIIPYFIFLIFMGVGISSMTHIITRLIQTNHHRLQIMIVFFIFILSLMPALSQFKKNERAMAALKHDRTLEKLADDIFKGVEKGGVLSLFGDTSIFSVDYSYHVLKKRQDITYMSFPMLGYAYYRDTLQRTHPTMIMPSRVAKESMQDYVARFIQINATKHTFFYNGNDVDAREGFWIPNGLVNKYSLIKPATQPEVVEILKENQRLWSTFQNPRDGILGTYRHMMLSEILTTYAQKRLTLAQMQLYSKKMDTFRTSIDKIIDYDVSNVNFFSSFIGLLVEEKECASAEKLFAAYGSGMSPSPALYKTIVLYVETCPGAHDTIPNELSGYLSWDTPIE